VAIPFLLLAFVLTFLIVYSRILEASDTSGFFALNSLASSQLIADIAIIVTYFGSELILIPFAGLLYLLSKTNKLETVGVIPLGVDNESSFPSGHTARAFAVATLVSVRMGRKYVPLLALAIGVALSRIIIGVHFPSDVVGGAFLGIFIGLVSHEYGPRVYRYAVPRFFPGRRIP